MGYFEETELILVPSPDKVVEWTKKHRIVVLVRAAEIGPITLEGIAASPGNMSRSRMRDGAVKLGTDI